MELESFPCKWTKLRLPSCFSQVKLFKTAVYWLMLDRLGLLRLISSGTTCMYSKGLVFKILVIWYIYMYVYLYCVDWCLGHVNLACLIDNIFWKYMFCRYCKLLEKVFWVISEGNQAFKSERLVDMMRSKKQRESEGEAWNVGELNHKRWR